MISRYSFGKPFETEALVVKIEATEGKLPFFRTDGEGNYYYDFDDRWRNNPNLKELDFKYNSLEELKDDADNEFERRHDKYINRHRCDW